MSGDESRIEDLEDRVDNIDRRLGRIESFLEDISDKGGPKDASGVPKQKSPERKESSKEGDNGNDSGTGMPSLEAEVGLKWLGRIGVIAFVLGVAFSIRYVIQEELIGYLSRVVLGFSTGIGLTGLGWYAKEKLTGYNRWGSMLMGGGSAIIYFVAYATYHFTSYREALGITLEQNVILLTTVAFSIFVIAIREDSRALGAEAISAGFATAYLSTGIGFYILIYVGLLGAGTAALSYYKKWPVLHFYGLISTMGIYLLWMRVGDYQSGLIFLTSMLAVFSASNIGMLSKAREMEDIGKFASLGSIYLLPSIFAAFAHIELGQAGLDYIYSIYFGVFAFQSMMYFVSESLGVELKDHYLYSGLPFALAGTWLFFSVFWSTVIFAALGVLLVVLSLQLERREFSYAGYFVSAVTAFKVLSYDSWNLGALSFSEPLSSTRLFAYLAVISAFTLIYVLTRVNRNIIQQLNLKSGNIERAYSWVLAVLILALIGLELEGFRLSVLWGIYGVYLLVLGIKLRLSYFRQQAIMVLALTTIKVFVLDTAGLDTLSRTISFLVLGLLLIVSSFIYTNYRNRIEKVVE